MECTWIIIEKYCSGVLNQTNTQPIINAMTTLTSLITTMQQAIPSLKMKYEEQSSPTKQIPNKKFSSLQTKCFHNTSFTLDVIDYN